MIQKVLGLGLGLGLEQLVLLEEMALQRILPEEKGEEKGKGEGLRELGKAPVLEMAREMETEKRTH